MQNYLFLSSRVSINFEIIKVEDLTNLYPDFQSVALESEEELKILFDLLGWKEIEGQETSNSAYTKYWDLSKYRLPEIDVNEYDDIFEEWIQKTNKESNMNEYGNLIFLLGKNIEWNKLNYKYVVKEKST